MRAVVDPLLQLWRFLKSPTRPLPAFAGPWRQCLFYVHLMALVLVIEGVWIAGRAMARDVTGLQSRDFGPVDFRLVLTLVVLAPLYEELVFRSWLKHAAWLPVVALLMWLFSLLGNLFTAVQVASYLLALVMLLLRKADLKARSQRGDALLFRQLPLTLPASTLAFAIAHTSNWDIGRDALWTLPLAVMPQFISGLAFAYARMRSGLHVAMGLHASLNLLVVLVGWAVQQA